jgi:hypothetical protein
MKTNELKLFERGFWDALMGVQSDLPGLQANPSGVESNARNKFMQKMNVRALNAFTNAYKNQGINIDKSFGRSSQQTATTQPQSTTSVAQPAASAQAPAAQAPAAAPAQAASTASTTEPQVFTFGGQKYTKGPKGWVDSKGKAADTNTANILNQAASKAGLTSTTKKATANQQPNTTGTAVPKGKSTVPQGGGRVLGYLSQTPNAIRKRQARAAAKAVPAPTAQPAVKQPRQTVAQKAQGYLQQQALKKQAAPGKLAEYTINENVYNNDSKFVQWNRMLMEQTTGVSPGDYILPIINQMMAPAKLEDNPNYQVIQNAVLNWENAFKAQVAKTGQFDGKFDAKTQDAWNNVLAVVADAAFATLAANKPEKQAKP